MKFVTDLHEYKAKSERVEGFKILKKVGLRIPWPIKVITHEAFEEYKKNGLTEEIKTQIKVAFEEILSKNPGKSVAIRRAYFVPGMENPPGPRSSSVRNLNIVFKNVKKMFDFAIENKFDKEGSQIVVFMHPFINPVIPLAGGCVTLHRGVENSILIEAIYGNDEGVQSFPHDKYVVSLDDFTILEKLIQYKPQCLKVNDEMTYSIIDVPKKLRSSQVLDDKTIIKIAKDYKKLKEKIGECRLEFGKIKEGVFYTECTLLSPIKELKEIEVGKEVKIVKISDVNDINKVKSAKAVFVDPSIIRERRMDILLALAYNLPQGAIVLYPGTATTAHAATIFRELGYTLVLVENEIFEEGEEIKLQLMDGIIKVKREKNEAISSKF